MAELELELQLAIEQASKDLAKFAKAFSKTTEKLGKQAVIMPKIDNKALTEATKKTKTLAQQLKELGATDRELISIRLKAELEAIDAKEESLRASKKLTAETEAQFDEQRKLLKLLARKNLRLLNEKELKKTTKQVENVTEETKDFLKTIRKIGPIGKKAVTRLRKEFTLAEKDFSRLGDSIFNTRNLLVGLAGAFAVNELLNAIDSVTDAAIVQEDAVNQLNSSLALAGDFSEEASADLQAFASELQQTTRFGDETVLSLLSLSKGFGASNDQAKDLVLAATDLSAAFGIDAESAVRNLGKTFSGLTGELGELVPELKNLTAEQLKSGAAIDLISNRFGGAAQAATKTYGGAVDQLSNNFGDLLEEIGFIITKNPVVIELINQLSEGFQDLGKFINDNSDSIRDFVNEGILTIADNGPAIIRAIGKIAKGGVSIARAFNTVDGVVSSVLLEILNGSDKIAEAFKNLLSPINAIAKGIAAVKKIQLEREIIKAGEESVKITRALNDIATRLGKNSKAFARASENAAKKQKLIQDGIAATRKEVELLEQVSDDITTEINIDTKLTKDKLEARIDAAVQTEIQLDGLEQKIESATGELVEGAKKGAAALRESAKQPVASSKKFANNVEQGGKSLKDKLIEAAIEFAKATVGILAQGITATKSALDAEVALAEQKAEFERVGAKEINAELSSAKDAAEQIKKEIRSGEKTEEEIADLKKDLLKNEKDQVKIREKFSKKQEEFAKQQLEIEKQKAKAGEEGFANLFSAGTGALINAFLPGIGDLVAPLVNALALGGADAATQFVEQLALAAPQIITNLAEATPAIILALAEQADVIIIALARAVPLVAVELIKNLDVIFAELFLSFIQLFEGAAVAIADALVDTIDLGPALKEGAAEFSSRLTTLYDNTLAKFGDGIQKLIDVIEDLTNVDIGPTLEPGGTGQGLVPDSVPVLGGLAQGGLVGGTGNRDSEVFALTPGEMVVDRSTTQDLQDFLANQAGSGNSSEVVLVLAQILNALQQPMNVTATAEVDSQAFADIQLQLSRLNERTAV